MGPAWWEQAVALERQDKLGEAEQLIDREVRARGGPPDWQTADLYANRARRLRQGGDAAGARAAAAKAIDWARAYASGATSGGEGTARSAEIAPLVTEMEAISRG